MKKLFIGLLIIVAAGAGVYFYLKTKQQMSPAPSPGNQERILGKWNIDSIRSDTNDTSYFSLLLLDSFYKTTSFAFQPEGKLTVSNADIPKTDTAVYAFTTDTTMVWKADKASADSFTVRIGKLDTTLVLNTGNQQYNSTLYLRKAE